MTDLEINIALAQALGWQASSHYAVMLNQFEVFRQKVICNDNGTLRKFDFRAPVIFLAICRRWKLDVNFHKDKIEGFVSPSYTSQLSYRHNALDGDMEKAAALVVIEYVRRKKMIDELVKRGSK